MRHYNIKKCISRIALPFGVMLFCIGSLAQPVKTFPLSAVKLTDGPFKHAQQTNIKYIMAMEPDRLLAPFLREAGLPTKTDSYGNWEGSGLDGHIGGHYLTALSLAYVATGDKQLKQRLDYMVSELHKAQLKHGDGYIGGVPGGRQAWDDIRKGKIKADLFSLNNKWVPWYNLHKIYAGLRDAYLLGGNDTAKTMLLNLGQWTKNLVADLSDEQVQQMLIAEHGGMNEVLVDIADISGDKSYLDLAKRFSHQLILQPLLKGQDKLNGLHANTQIPKVIGYLRHAEETGNQDWQQAADFFWNTVSKKRSVSIGGNSVREHFHDSENFDTMMKDVEGPETCNTYNMLKLSKMLFEASGEPQYLAFYERAMYNHILSSQHPDHGGLVYFTPMRPGHYRMYSKVDAAMWCCVGSGIENHSKYAELIYAKTDSELLVNMFIPSKLTASELGLSLTQQTLFPDNNRVSIKLNKLASAESIQAVTLQIRKPAWADENGVAITVNGVVVEPLSTRDGYIVLKRQWQDGDEIELNLSVSPRLEGLPDGSHNYSVLYGPVVMAAKVNPFKNEQLEFIADDSRMAHVATGPVCPPEATPIIVGQPESFLKGLRRIARTDIGFTTSANLKTVESDSQTPLTLMPFFRLHDSRYQVYWAQMQENEFSDFVATAAKQSEHEKQLRLMTLDVINPGEQQFEVEHDYAGEGSRAGVHLNQHWRDTFSWFSYRLRDPGGQAKSLRIRYFGGDKGRHFSILFNGELLAAVTLPDDKGSDFYDVDYALPTALVDKLQYGTHELKFVAGKDSIAGGIYGIRLLK
ncbi:glycoside hydrolase family 127 protein [Alteromonadaceae bacterium BrNp21-10]|nr:glycoside hydrolase family 127 protein [Alteromonadaceae bacterium BrNp21-10]